MLCVFIYCPQTVGHCFLFHYLQTMPRVPPQSVVDCNASSMQKVARHVRDEQFRQRELKEEQQQQCDRARIAQENKGLVLPAHRFERTAFERCVCSIQSSAEKGEFRTECGLLAEVYRRTLRQAGFEVVVPIHKPTVLDVIWTW